MTDPPATHVNPPPLSAPRRSLASGAAFVTSCFGVEQTRVPGGATPLRPGSATSLDHARRLQRARLLSRDNRSRLKISEPARRSCRTRFDHSRICWFPTRPSPWRRRDEPGPPPRPGCLGRDGVTWEALRGQPGARRWASAAEVSTSLIVSSCEDTRPRRRPGAGLERRRSDPA